MIELIVGAVSSARTFLSNHRWLAMKYQFSGIDTRTGKPIKPFLINVHNIYDVYLFADLVHVSIGEIKRQWTAKEIPLLLLWFPALIVVLLVMILAFQAHSLSLWGILGGILVYGIALIAAFDHTDEPPLLLRWKRSAYLSFLIAGSVLMTAEVGRWFIFTHGLLDYPLPERFLPEHTSHLSFERVVNQALAIWGCLAVGAAGHDNSSFPIVKRVLWISAVYLGLFALVLLGHSLFSFTVIEGDPIGTSDAIYVGFSGIEFLGGLAIGFIAGHCWLIAN
ncbi:MAG: hypothetical protein JW779_03685 [Candidatus Thorarchaeota archaeon]|nr:hypothetical protein [Candidatus Thorarchaeota archaeon]